MNLDKILGEVKVWAKLEHDSIVGYKSSWIEKGDWISFNEGEPSPLKNQQILYIQMEICRMTLREAFIQICKELDQNDKKGVTVIGAYIATEIFSEILEGVNYLHKQSPPIIHRDLKLSNILVSNKSKSSIIKLSDFGLSIPHGKDNPNTKDIESLNINYKHSQNCGTYKYMASEVKSGKYSTSADMYSLGIILCELFCLKFEDLSNFEAKDYQRYLPTKQVNLIRDLTQEWVSKRPNCEIVLNTKQKWCLNFEDIKFTNQLRKLIYSWWENYTSDSREKNKDYYNLSIEILLNKSHKTVLGNLMIKDPTEKKSNIILEEFKSMRDVLEGKVRMIDEVSNINEETIKKNILMVILHGLNICENFEDFCFFMEKELNEIFPKYWHCFTTTYLGPLNTIINWFKSPVFIINFGDEFHLIMQVILINTIIEMPKKVISRRIGEDCEIVKTNGFNAEMSAQAIKLCADALSMFKTKRELQTHIINGYKKIYANEDWNCFISENELISWHSTPHIPEKYIALTMMDYCILIVNEPLEILDEKISALGLTSSMARDDKNDIQNTFSPQFINSRLVLKKIESSDGNLCLLRVVDDLKSTQKGYNNYKFNFFNIQFLRMKIRKKENVNQIQCAIAMRTNSRGIKRYIMSETETKNKLEKLLNNITDAIISNDEILKYLLDLRKILSNNIVFLDKDEKFLIKLRQLVISFIDMANKISESKNSKIKLYLKDQTEELQNILLQTINDYITNIKDDKEIIFENIFRKYVPLLTSDDDNECYFALLAFHRIIRHCKVCYMKCYEIDLLDAISRLVIPSKSLEIILNASSIIQFFLTYPDLHKLKKVEIQQILVITNLLIDHPFENIVLTFLTVLRILKCNYYVNRDLILKSGVISKMIKLLVHDNQQIRFEIVNSIGLIIYHHEYDDQLTSVWFGYFNLDIFVSLEKFLNSDSPIAKGNAINILVSISFENDKNIQLLIDAHIIPSLFHVINNGSDNMIILALKTIFNIMQVCNGKQSSNIYSKDTIKSLSDSLTMFSNDEEASEINVMILEILFRLYMKSDGNKIQILNDFKESNIIETVKSIQLKYNDPKLKGQCSKFLSIFL